jgi:hypothetical protein
MNLLKKRIIRGGAVVLLSALGAAVGTLFVSEIPGFSISGHAFRIHLWALTASAALLGLTFIAFWLLYSRTISRLLGTSFEEVLERDARTFIPLAFIGSAPVTLIHYLGAADVLSRTRLLVAAAIFLAFVLKAGQFREWRRRSLESRPEGIPGIFRLSIRVKPIGLVLGALAAFNLGSVLMLQKGAGFSGDEPHYLLMDYSLLHDGDLDLANNYRQRDYNAYMIKPVTIPQAHVVAGSRPGSQYSFHSPGVSFLLLPFFAAGSLFGKAGLILWLRFGMSLFGALFALQVFLFVRDEWKDERQAFVAWAVVALATPVYFYSIHVYPELVVGFFAFVVFRIFRAPARPGPGRLLVSGLLVSTFIWFHALKYIFLAGPLILYCLWVLFRKRARLLDFGRFLLFPVLITAAYLMFQKALYGSYSLSAVSWKGSLGAGETLAYAKELLTGIPFRFRWETLAGYFFDQKDGLLFYAPVYFFSFLGLVEMARKKTSDFLAILFIASPYVLVSAFLTQRTGYAPQARPLVAVIWALVIGLGYFLAHNAKRLYSGAFFVASAGTLGMTWLLLANPLSLYQETTMGTMETGGGIFYVLSNLHWHWTDLLPAYAKSREGPWPPNAVWIGIFVLAVLAYALSRRRSPALSFAGRARGVFVTILGLLFFWTFVLYPRTVLYNPTITTFTTGEKLTLYSMSRVARAVEPGKFLLPDDGRAYVFTFSSRRKLGRLRLEFGSRAGSYDTSVTLFDSSLFTGNLVSGVTSLDLQDPPAYEFKGSWLYILKIDIGTGQGVNTSETPYIFNIQPVVR